MTEANPLHFILNKRDDSCLQCPDLGHPKGRNCVQIVQQCHKCGYYKCDSTTNIGGIVGGVIGGLALLVAVIGVIYWHRKNRRKSNKQLRLEAQEKEILESHEFKDTEEAAEASDFLAELGPPGVRTRAFKSPGQTSSIYSSDTKYNNSRRNSRNSVSTFSSFASSALTRASNIIPVAYIPGVKIRSDSMLIKNSKLGPDLDYVVKRKKRDSTVTAVRGIPKVVDRFSDDEEEPLVEQAKAVYKDKSRVKRKSIPGLTHIVDDSEGLTEVVSLDSEHDSDSKSNRFSTQLSIPKSKLDPKFASNRPSSSILLDIVLDGDRHHNPVEPLNPFDDAYQTK